MQLEVTRRRCQAQLDLYLRLKRLANLKRKSFKMPTKRARRVCRK